MEECRYDHVQPNGKDGASDPGSPKEAEENGSGASTSSRGSWGPTFSVGSGSDPNDQFGWVQRNTSDKDALQVVPLGS